MSGILCIQQIFTQELKIDLGRSYAEAIWALTLADLKKKQSIKQYQDTIELVERAETGDLPPSAREILRESIGHGTIGCAWRPIGVSDVEEQVLERLYAYLRQCKVISDEQDPYLGRHVTLVETDDAKGKTIRVRKRMSGLYDIDTKNSGQPDCAYVMRHPDCCADDVIRALGHYLQF